MYMSWFELEKPPIDVIEVLNAVRMGREPKAKESGYYYRFRTQRDNKVCKICSPLDGKLWSMNNMNEATIPWVGTHPNCRCSLEFENWVKVKILDRPETTLIETDKLNG